MNDSTMTTAVYRVNIKKSAHRILGFLLWALSIFRRRLMFGFFCCARANLIQKLRAFTLEKVNLFIHPFAGYSWKVPSMFFRTVAIQG
jgi:hypothetical protein